MTHTDPTAAGLLAGVLARPECDTARLVYADRLTEIAGPPRECPRCVGWSLRADMQISGSWPCPTCRGPAGATAQGGDVMEPLTLEWLEQVVRGFVCTYNRSMGGVMATDFTVTVAHQKGDTFGVYLSNEHGRRAGGLCSTRAHFRALASVVGLPLRESESAK